MKKKISKHPPNVHQLMKKRGLSFRHTRPNCEQYSSFIELSTQLCFFSSHSSKYTVTAKKNYEFIKLLHRSQCAFEIIVTKEEAKKAQKKMYRSI